MDEWIKAVNISYNVILDPTNTRSRLRMNDKVLYFHDKTVKPPWAKGMKVSNVFDGHRFYEIKKDK